MLYCHLQEHWPGPVAKQQMAAMQESEVLIEDGNQERMKNGKNEQDTIFQALCCMEEAALSRICIYTVCL